MPTEFISLMVQVPLVAAFVWFALAMVQHQRKATEADQVRFLEHEKALQHETHQFQATQNERFDEILRVERERRREAMDQGLREVGIVAAAITKLADAMTLQSEAFSRHDAAALERHTRIIDELRNGHHEE